MDQLESVSGCGVGYLGLGCCLVPTLDFKDSLCWNGKPVLLVQFLGEWV